MSLLTPRFFSVIPTRFCPQIIPKRLCPQLHEELVNYVTVLIHSFPSQTRGQRVGKNDTKGVYLRFQEQRRLDIANQVIQGQISMERAAILLQKSLRQTRRIVSAVKKNGVLGVKHGNTGRIPVNKTDDSLKRLILDLLRDRYFDFNLSHFIEQLQSEYRIEIGHETLRLWAHREGLVKRAKKCKRRAKPHKRRPRMPAAGMLLQLDGSQHEWFGPKHPSYALIGGIDDATSICPHAELFPAEDTLSVLATLKQIVENVGVPEVLYVDQAGHFGKRVNKLCRIDWEAHLTHVERAMNELGCQVIFAPSPQAKGRIERMWDTFQDRLIPELRLKNIQTIPAANRYLKEQFIPDFNRRFSVPPVKKKSVYKAIPKMWEGRLDWVFCKREYRKVDLGECISWNGKTYLVTNNYGLTLKRMTVEIRTRIDGRVQAYYAGREIALCELGSTKALNLKAA